MIFIAGLESHCHRVILVVDTFWLFSLQHTTIKWWHRWDVKDDFAPRPPPPPLTGNDSSIYIHLIHTSTPPPPCVVVPPSTSTRKHTIFKSTHLPYIHTSSTHTNDQHFHYSRVPYVPHILIGRIRRCSIYIYMIVVVFDLLTYVYIYAHIYILILDL